MKNVPQVTPIMNPKARLYSFLSMYIHHELSTYNNYQHNRAFSNLYKEIRHLFKQIEIWLLGKTRKYIIINSNDNKQYEMNESGKYEATIYNKDKVIVTEIKLLHLYSLHVP